MITLQWEKLVGRLGLMTMLIFIISTQTAYSQNSGVVSNCQSNLNMRSAPSTQSKVLTRIPCQNSPSVNILSEHNGWYKVIYNGTEGYVFSQFIDVTNAVHQAVEGLEHIPHFFRRFISPIVDHECSQCRDDQEQLEPEEEMTVTPPFLPEGEIEEPSFSPLLPEGVFVDSNLRENFERLGGDPIALEQALCFLNRHRDSRFDPQGAPGHPQGIGIGNERYITINDLNKRSNELRLFILDLQTGKVRAFQSGHGRGVEGGRHGENSRQVARHSSNVDNSNLQPSGFFITGNRYQSSGNVWQYGMRMHGLQEGLNDRSFARGIVLHQGLTTRNVCLERAPAQGEKQGECLRSRTEEISYVPNLSASSSEEAPVLRGSSAGNTQGCTGVSPDHWESIMSTIQSGIEGKEHQIKSYRDQQGNEQRGYPTNGSLYYNYSSFEQEQGAEYCGDHPDFPLGLMGEN